MSGVMRALRERIAFSALSDALSVPWRNGDLIVRSGGEFTRLAVGADGQILTVIDGFPTWAPEKGITNAYASITDGINIANANTGFETIRFQSMNNPLRIEVQEAGTTDLVKFSLNMTFDDLIDVDLTGAATGDLIYKSSTDWTRLGIGLDGQVLTVEGSLPKWKAPTGGVNGNGTTNRIVKWTTGTTVGDSRIFDDPVENRVRFDVPVTILDPSGAGHIELTSAVKNWFIYVDIGGRLNFDDFPIGGSGLIVNKVDDTTNVTMSRIINDGSFDNLFVSLSAQHTLAGGYLLRGILSKITDDSAVNNSLGFVGVLSEAVLGATATSGNIDSISLFKGSFDVEVGAAKTINNLTGYELEFAATTVPPITTFRGIWLKTLPVEITNRFSFVSEDNSAIMIHNGRVSIGSLATPSAVCHITGTGEQLRLAYGPGVAVKFFVDPGNGLIMTPLNNSIKQYNFTNVAGITVLNVDTIAQKVGINTESPNSSFHVNGSVALTIVSKTANYNVTEFDCVVLADAAGGPITIRLPSGTGRTGRIYAIKKVDSSANNVVITSGGSRIDGQNSITLTMQNDLL